MESEKGDITSCRKLRRKSFRMEIILEMRLERWQIWRERFDLQGGEDRSLQAKVADVKAWSPAEGTAPCGMMGTVGKRMAGPGPDVCTHVHRS